MDLVEFWTVCSSNGIVLDREQMRKFKRYEEEILYWNKKVNMISRKDEENFLSHHVLHSLAILKYINLERKARCLDIGTGAGLPGIPLAIAVHGIHILLVDSIAKKMKITEMLAKHTGIKTIETKLCRAESLEKRKEYGHQFDYIFARAVAASNKIVSWVRNLLKPNGKIVIFKGGDLTQEVDDLKKYFPKINVKEESIKMLGADWFEKDNKKLLILSF